jgi:hypothetical protein
MQDVRPREVLRVGFIRLVPRRRWARVDYLGVAAATVLALLIIGGEYLAGEYVLGSVTAADLRVTIERSEIAHVVAPLKAMQAELTTAASGEGALLARRRSGLTLVRRIVDTGDAVGRDGIATLIDSSGRVDGIAPNYDAISRIWGRLGATTALSNSKPQGDGIAFSFVPGDAPLPSPAPVATTTPAAAAVATH